MLEKNLSKTIVKQIMANRTWPLRHQMLRPHQSIEKVKYPEDEDAEVIHFGAMRARLPLHFI